MYEITFLYGVSTIYLLYYSCCCRDNMSALDEAAFTPYKEQIGANAQCASGAQNHVVRILFANFMYIHYISVSLFIKFRV